MNLKEVPAIRWIKFGIAAVIYILWVLWVDSYWLFIGLPIVFDLYITKKIPWDFWKKTKNGKKPNAVIEWVDAIVFALVAVYIINIFLFQNYKIPTPSLEKTLLVGDHLFVSKVSYGPRMPITPISFPLVQNTFPITNSKSYTDWPQWDYKRIKGLANVQRNNIVVFNFPAGDTIAFLAQNPSYYELAMRDIGNQIFKYKGLSQTQNFRNDYERNHFLLELGKKEIQSNPGVYGEIMYRPVDRRENYVKRCVAMHGDTLEIRHNQVFINGVPEENPENLMHIYHILTDGSKLSDELYEKLDISNEDKKQGGNGPIYSLPLTVKNFEMLKKASIIKNIVMEDQQPDSSGMNVFPYSTQHPWSRDNYGPLWIPEQGVTIDIDTKNIVIYERIITAYEGNQLEVKGDDIFINGQLTTRYTFKQNYYFMMGDNRHKSADSRYWGFVPEDHIVGKPILVWLSLDQDGTFPFNIRWSRFFKWVASE